MTMTYKCLIDTKLKTGPVSTWCPALGFSISWHISMFYPIRLRSLIGSHFYSGIRYGLRVYDPLRHNTETISSSVFTLPILLVILIPNPNPYRIQTLTTPKPNGSISTITSTSRPQLEHLRPLRDHRPLRDPQPYRIRSLRRRIPSSPEIRRSIRCPQGDPRLRELVSRDRGSSSSSSLSERR